MRNSVAIAFILALPVAAVDAQESASWLRSRTLANALNPRISVLGHVIAQSGPTRAETDLALQEVELGLQSEIDPYGRADFFIAKPHGEGVEIEEGYFTLTSLPAGLQARGGKFLASFGKLNMLHRFERPGVNSPLVLDRFLGPEGLVGTGGELARVLAPFGIFTELSYAFLQDLGEADPEAEAATATVIDANGNTATVPIHEEQAAAPRRARDYAHVARARAYSDLTDAANIELGVSGASHQPTGALHRRLLGADVTLRWRRPEQSQYRGLIWRSEMIWSRRVLPAEFDAVSGAFVDDPARIDRRSLYSLLEFQVDRRWFVGVRADYAEQASARAGRAPTRALAPFVMFSPSEFQRLTAQYDARVRPSGSTDHLAALKWTVVLGPHGAHPF
ncbi:MAG: hypothetical protein HY549_10235 [Elusimicrobia bacterium]|nr:hypothetical protein [Elusimicrobiota bacterium]